jgi:superoxide dismutase, Cu-Zn family
MKFTAALALAMTVAYATETETETESVHGAYDVRALNGLLNDRVARGGYQTRAYRAPVSVTRVARVAPQASLAHGMTDYSVISTIRPRDVKAFNVAPVDAYWKGYKADETIVASCEFDFLGYSHSNARMELKQKPGDLTSIIGEVEGMAGGLHGLKIHEFGDLEYGCESTGHVYNPYGSRQGNSHEDILNRRVGDLEQLQVRWDATGNYKNRDALVMLSGPNSVIGRSMVIYERMDDHHITERPATYERELRVRKGMGERVACCVIGLAKGEKKVERGVPPASTKLVRPAKPAPKLQAAPKVVKVDPRIVQRGLGYGAIGAGYGYADQELGYADQELGYADQELGYGYADDLGYGGYGGYGRGGW